MQETSARSEPTPTVDDFLRIVMRSGLLAREQLQQSLRTLPVEQRGSASLVARHLVKQGKLSQFQAGKLLRGTCKGLLLGPFQVLAPIGRGGMGTVYLARDQRSNQLVALKILPPRRARTEERILCRFRREMEMCQRLAHKNLAWTYEVGLCQGVHYIAMEYIPGRSLHRLVVEEGPLNVPRAARLMSEVADALEHTHTQGLIHRDIKPANIMVTPHDHAKVLDLGLALVRGEKGGAREVVGGVGYVVGTMDFIAPEQAENPCLVDPRSDIYSLGCTLYYALTGQPPFPGGTNKEKLQRHLTQDPLPLESLNPSIPPGFVRLVHRMLAKDRDQRFSSAALVQEELAPWIGSAPELPMDLPTDSTYRQAVAALNAKENDSSEDNEAILDSDEEPTLLNPDLLEDPVLLNPDIPAPCVRRPKTPWLLWIAVGALVSFFLALFLLWLVLT